MDSVCQICGQQFQGLNSNLKRHLLGHGELPFKCHICVKSFARSDTLRKHIITHNDNSELHDCEQCELLLYT